MTRRSLADEHLAPMVREVFAEMIDELPPLRPEVPSDGAARVDAQRSAARSTLRVVALAAACVVLVGGLAFVASRRGDDSVATAPTSSSPDESRLADSAPWEDGVRMIVYVGAEASEESLRSVRDALEGFSDIVDADGNRYLGPRESLDEARRLLADDPVTLDLLTVENIPTAFYIAPRDGVTSEALRDAAARIEVMPNVTRVDLHPEDRATTPGIAPEHSDSGPSTSGGVVSPNTTQPPDTFVEVEDPLAAGAWSGARTGADGQSLLLFFVGAADYQPGDPCSMRYLPTVEEIDAAVNVTIHGERPTTPDGSGSYGCMLVGYARSVSVELTQPLGDRKLIVLDAEREVFDGTTLAQPTWVPDGWQEELEQPAALSDRPGAAAWSRTWAPPNPEPQDGACVAGNSGFTLFEGDAELVDSFPAEPGETVIDTYDINGATATYSTRDDLGISRLTWIESDRGYVLKSFPDCAGDEPPSIDTMLQFARGLES